MIQEQVDLQDELAATKAEIIQLSLQLGQFEGERNLSSLLADWKCHNEHFCIDQLLLMKKLSHEKDREITQLKSLLKTSEGEFGDSGMIDCKMETIV